ncbi:MAG: hypothetical protein HOV67_05510 [Kribbellaceae bacterium]|nr:hypothetical protein [Kribbellaceae bacterium]
MRQMIGIAAAAAVLFGAAQLPAAAASPEAPTDLQLSWVTDNHKVRIAWTDGGDANIVRLEYQGGGVSKLVTWRADLPNEYVRSGVALAAVDRVVRISVVSVDAAGVESAPVVSPWFDTIGAPVPTFTAATPLADGSLKLDWSLSDVPADTTPGDPLDLPSTNETVHLAIDSTPIATGQGFRLPAGTTSTTLPPHPRPYPVRLMTENEWSLRGGYTGASSVVFSEMTAGLTMPATGVYSGSVQLAGLAGVRLCVNPTVNCPDPSNPFVANPGIQIQLQSRPDAARPWKTIGRYTSQELRFSTSFRVYGGSQYRLYVPSWSHLDGRELTVAPAISTSARYTAVLAKFVTAGFNTSVAQVGQQVTASVSVQPAGTVKADLQWYDGKIWRHAAYISLTRGRGTFAFKAAGRGTTRSWRVVVPKMTMNGLPIQPTPSRALKLTVR